MVTEEITTQEGHTFTSPNGSGSLTISVSVGAYGGLETLAYRLAIEVTDAEGIDENIFTYQDVTAQPGRDEVDPLFTTVATPVHMAELGTEPDPDNGVYFFRQSSISLDYESASKMVEALTNIRRRIRALLANLEALLSVSEIASIEYTFTAESDGSSEAGSSEAGSSTPA